MVYHYEHSPHNSHHKVIVNLQASNNDALKSKSCVMFSQTSIPAERFPLESITEVVVFSEIRREIERIQRVSRPKRLAAYRIALDIKGTFYCDELQFVVKLKTRCSW